MWYEEMINAAKGDDDAGNEEEEEEVGKFPEQQPIPTVPHWRAMQAASMMMMMMAMLLLLTKRRNKQADMVWCKVMEILD